MARPVIGVTMDSGNKPDRYGLWFAYTKAVEAGGGLPLALPYQTDHGLIAQMVEHLDGILFTGGDDIDPALFGEERHPNAIPIDPDRTRFEMALLAEAQRRRTPSLCICLGIQMLNVHRGGSLHQFLPDVPRPNAIEHRRLGDVIPRHPIRIEPDSLLHQAVGKGEVLANSYHKQAIGRLGRGLRVVATAPDGVIEGVEDPTYPLLLGVQWHPERLYDEPDHLALFSLLARAATRRT
jgi:putative glutamine amidotransferase